ncbi:putative dihydrofolate reductase [Biomphalaria glabrata]|uniref:dihydrofolate reductase n=1 Tax=Biomphalaria glabrata TaxID=6526 RepID=A0A9W3BJX6_BIOGL|nr:putative dihydrofolate reductase [Biomphalaria glabrata]XP_055899717.1 putative dihydrofolate reductase [Biomphalaria glabrata]
MSCAPIVAVAAICNGHKGIGKNKDLPWPFLKEDHEFYTGLCKTTKDPKKKNGIITGRVGWEGWSEEKKTDPKITTVVISKSLPKDEPHCRGVARSFEEAINMLSSGPDKDKIETIYNIGGRLNYEHSVSDVRCKKLVLTRIFQDFESDVYFPDFEHAFERVSDPEIDDRIREDPSSKIKFRFEVWVRKSDQ